MSFTSLRTAITNAVNTNSNQKMMEAYMLGVNYEINSELLWRGCPTDQRGTPFRHFWNFENGLQGSNYKNLASNEGLKDILPIRQWRTGLKNPFKTYAQTDFIFINNNV